MSKVEKWKSGKPPPTLHSIFFEKSDTLSKKNYYLCVIIKPKK